MTTIKIGLIAAPGFATDITKNIEKAFKKMLRENISTNIDWELKIQINSVTGSAEHVHKCVDFANKIKEKNDWDYAICITDLPSMSNAKTVVSDLSSENKTGLISLPALGWIKLQKKLCHSLLFMVKSFYYSTQFTNNIYIKDYKKAMPEKIKKVEPNEKGSTDNRFIYQSIIVGFMKLICGMTFANRPWKAIFSFKKILALSFATGTYISIFSTPWQLSSEFSILRFVFLTIISLGGIMFWLIYAHHLWEHPSSKSQRKYRYIYNATTFFTLLSINILNYLFLFILLSLSAYFFVPNSLFETMTTSNTNNNFQNFIRLSWFTTSVGLLAGAFGSTMEKEEVVQEMAYSSRQKKRAVEVNKQYEKEKEFKKRSNREEAHEGKAQSHKEEY